MSHELGIGHINRTENRLDYIILTNFAMQYLFYLYMFQNVFAR